MLFLFYCSITYFILLLLKQFYGYFYAFLVVFFATSSFFLNAILFFNLYSETFTFSFPHFFFRFSFVFKLLILYFRSTFSNRYTLWTCPFLHFSGFLQCFPVPKMPVICEILTGDLILILIVINASVFLTYPNIFFFAIKCSRTRSEKSWGLSTFC